MQVESVKFDLAFTAKVRKQLDELPKKDRKQYDKSFEILVKSGPAYRSLRTHRYRCRNDDIWSSSASMAKRFYWQYTGKKSILVMYIDSH